MRAVAEGKRETAHRIIHLAGRVIRYAIGTRRAEADPTPALRGSLPSAPEKHLPAPTTPEALAEVLKAIWSYKGSIVVKAALEVLA